MKISVTAIDAENGEPVGRVRLEDMFQILNPNNVYTVS